MICNRELWLASQPKVADKYTSDDTRILRKMVEYALILRSAAVSVRYIQRTELKKVFRHTLQRGPLFADYYLRPGGRYYLLYWVIWLILGLIILSVVLQPMAGLLGGGLLLLGVSIVVVLYLSQTWADILVVGVCLPIIAGAFGLGILKWQIAQLIKPFTAKQQSPV